MKKLTSTMRVSDLPDFFQFVSDTQDVEAVRENLSPLMRRQGYDSYWVFAEDGEYVLVYGMDGIVPHMDKYVYKVAGSVGAANLLARRAQLDYDHRHHKS